MKKKNPKFNKEWDYLKSDDKDWQENIVHFKLPEEDGTKSFGPKWEKNTYQINFYETPEAAIKAGETQETFVWLPRSMFKGRILWGTGIRPISALDRSPHKDVLGSVQYILHDDHAEVIWIAVRRGYKRRGIANYLLQAVLEEREDVRFWEPTEAGGKLEKAVKKAKTDNT